MGYKAVLFVQEEIETISLQNENLLIEEDVVDETSFIEQNGRLGETSIASPKRLGTPGSGMQSRKGSVSKVSSPLVSSKCI